MYKELLKADLFLIIVQFFIKLVLLHVWYALFSMILLNIRSSQLSPDLRHTVHSQLKDSLLRYNEDGFLLREAWDNTWQMAGMDAVV